MKINEKKVANFNGEDVISYCIKNENGVEIKILNYGGIITDIITPDKKGNMKNIILKYDDINSYLDNPSYLGAFVGRTAGRIYKGNVNLNNEEIEFNKNYDLHQGHGGNCGFNKQFYDVKKCVQCSSAYIELSRISPDLEENYPGNLEVKVRYTLNDNNEFEIEYYGKSDKDTLVNLTNHSYFNLSGNGSKNILNQYLYVNSTDVLELDETQGVIGNTLNIENTEFDFTVSKRIGKDIDGDHEQLKIGKGYDIPWVLRDNENTSLEVYDKESGRCMELLTDRSCLILYSHNYPDDNKLENGLSSQWRYGLAIEAQNQPIGKENAFIENSILRKDEEYKSKTIYKFSIK